MRHIIPISGKDSLTTAVIQKTMQPELDYEYFYNAIGTEPPEIYQWLSKVESYLGKEITMVGSDLHQVIDNEGILPSWNKRFCTRMAKIQPMEEWLGNDKCTLYFGIRYDEQDRAGYTPKPNITVCYPLIQQKITLPAVLVILRNLRLTPPNFFWRSMFNLVQKELGDDAYMLKSLPTDVFYQVFAGRSRPNCYFCFFQKQSEWIWLLETHPKLFYKAVEMENKYGGKNYHWRADYSLLELAARAKDVKTKRAKKIAKTIRDIHGKITSGYDYEDVMVGTSCGLFCGK